MSIVALKRVSVVGLVSEKLAVLEQLQRVGCMHLLPLRQLDQSDTEATPEQAEEAHRALRHLLDVRHKRHPQRNAQGFVMAEVVHAVLANQRRLRDLGDRHEALQQRIRDLAQWGEFALPDLDDLAGHRLWFYIVPHRQMRHLQPLALPWQVVHRDARACWLVVLSPEEPAADALPVPRVHTGAWPLSQLRRRLEETTLELEDIQAERQALTRWIHLIARSLAAAEDQAALKQAATQAHEQDTLFAVQGWVPETALAELRQVTDAAGLALLVEAPADKDLPPTLLRNPEVLAAGEDLVGFYQVPAYRAWDPSLVLFFSFAVFFAMILSDAGYAALLAVMLAMFWRRMGRSQKGQRFRVLCGVLAAGSLGWGVLAGSYFGFAPTPGTLLAALAVIDLRNFEAMMHLSVAVGVAHLLLANAQAAWVQWGRPESRVSLGWIGVMLGLCAWWLLEAGSTQQHLAALLSVAGALTVLLGAGESRDPGMRGWLLRLLDGLRALTSITRLFGDALSYLRLFALGLASTSLALTFNDLAWQVRHEVEGPGLLLAILIMLVGHALNLALAIMSGVVHGLRLNYIEFYNWALSGEGYPFRAFRKKELLQ